MESERGIQTRCWGILILELQKFEDWTIVKESTNQGNHSLVAVEELQEFATWKRIQYVGDEETNENLSVVRVFVSRQNSTQILCVFNISWESDELLFRSERNHEIKVFLKQTYHMDIVASFVLFQCRKAEVDEAKGEEGGRKDEEENHKSS